MKVYAPKFKVLLYKTSSAIDSSVHGRDITDWIGEGGMIRTSKSVREPAGTFSISFADKVLLFSGTAGAPPIPISLYSLLAPMDAIEIFAVRTPTDALDNGLKILMRGLVSDIRREETMGPDGKPSRRVTISGHDFGKILLQQQMHFTPGTTDEGQTSSFGLLYKYFKEWVDAPVIQSAHISAEQFLTKFATITQDYLNKIISGTMLAMAGGGSDYPVKAIYPKGADAPGNRLLAGRFEPKAVTEFADISFWNFLSRNLDVGAFNELYVIDDVVNGAMQTWLVCKPNYQHLAVGGDALIVISDEEVQSISTRRSDARAANWFVVNISRGNLTDATTMQMDAKMTDYACHKALPDDAKFNAEDDYGWRKMEVNAVLFPPDAGYDLKGNLTEVERAANQIFFKDWLIKRTTELRDQNIKNTWYESVMLKIKGNENLRIGENVQLKRGSAEPETLYTVGVEHEIRPYVGFFTTLHTERGTGQLDFMEKRKGLYFDKLTQKGVL